MFDPDAHMPKIKRGMVYLGACLIACRRVKAYYSFKQSHMDRPLR